MFRSIKSFLKIYQFQDPSKMSGKSSANSKRCVCPPPQGQRRAGGSCNPGRISRNPYINFLRDFRRQHCGLSAVEVIRQGAQAWNHLSEEQRLPYIREAFYHPLRRRPCPTTMKAASGSRRSRGRSAAGSSGRTHRRRRSGSRGSSRRR